MQSGLAASDKKLLWGAAALALVLILGTLILSPGSGDLDSPVPSSYSPASGGALAAYMLLGDLNLPVERWERPPTDLAEIDPHSVLILAEPSEKPSEEERDALQEFVARGGRILFCGPEIRTFFLPATLSDHREIAGWKTFSPVMPSPFSRGAEHIEIGLRRYWGQLNPGQIQIYGEPGSPAVVVAQAGAGELIWWAGATPLTNAGLQQQDNLQFFLNSVTTSGGPLHILWDEYYHGERGSLSAYVNQTPVMWGAVQLLILTAVLMFTFSRRSGPTQAPVSPSRLSPLEFVDTMGGLYQRAKAGSIPVQVSYRHLRLELSRRLALPATSPDSALAQAAEERLGFRSPEFLDTLDTASAASQNPKLSAKKALELVRNLEQYLKRLAF
jgi:hypothetical protein